MVGSQQSITKSIIWKRKIIYHLKKNKLRRQTLTLKTIKMVNKIIIKIRRKKKERKKQNKNKKWLTELKKGISRKLNVQRTLMSKGLSGILLILCSKIRMRMGSGGGGWGLLSLKARIIQIRMIMITRSWVIIKSMGTIVLMSVRLWIASMLYWKS